MRKAETVALGLAEHIARAGSSRIFYCSSATGMRLSSAANSYLLIICGLLWYDFNNALPNAKVHLAKHCLGLHHNNYGARCGAWWMGISKGTVLLSLAVLGDPIPKFTAAWVWIFLDSSFHGPCLEFNHFNYRHVSKGLRA